MILYDAISYSGKEGGRASLVINLIIPRLQILCKVSENSVVLLSDLWLIVIGQLGLLLNCILIFFFNSVGKLHMKEMFPQWDLLMSCRYKWEVGIYKCLDELL